VAQANVKLTVDATNATRALQGVQNKTNSLQKSFGGLQRVVAGVGLTVLARQAVTTSANFQKLNVRLGLLTKASGTFARSQELAAQAQKSFGLSATEALEGITDITARLQPLGVSVEDIKTTFFGFNTAAKLAGASAIESSNAFRQLAQALGSGRLQGDEFRSISEQIPTILKPVADELGTTVGELKKFSSEGKITSAVVIRALKKIETEGSASLKELLKNDPTQVFKNLSNETENLSRAFGDALAPAILPVIRGITEITKAITDFINSGAGQITLIFTGIATAIKGVLIVAPILTAQLLALKANFAALVVGGKIFTGSLVGMKATLAATSVGFATATAATRAFKIALAGTGIGLVVVGLGMLAAKFIDNKNAAKEAADATKEFNKQLGIIEDEGGEAAKIIEEITKKQRELNKARIRPATEKRLKDDIKELKTRQKILEGDKDRKKIEADMKKFNDMTIGFLKEQNVLEQKLTGKTDEQITLEQKILDIKKQFEPEDAARLINLLKKNEKLKESIDLMEEEKKKAEELKQKFADIGEAIESSIKDNLRDAITGAQSFGQAMTNVLNRIRDKIIDAQIDKLIDGFGEAFSKGASGKEKKGLGGFLGGILGGLFKANGGPVKAGKPYIVGERQPELFVPRTSGTILPSTDIGGGSTTNNMITVNVDASGTSVQGNGSEADQLGQLIGGIVQATLVEESRAGGLLNR
jgi:tape measure domain-containing protein